MRTESTFKTYKGEFGNLLPQALAILTMDEGESMSEEKSTRVICKAHLMLSSEADVRSYEYTGEDKAFLWDEGLEWCRNSVENFFHERLNWEEFGQINPDDLKLRLIENHELINLWIRGHFESPLRKLANQNQSRTPKEHLKALLQLDVVRLGREDPKTTCS